jgi:hypothetical protein
MRFLSSAYGDVPDSLRRVEWFAPFRSENRQPSTADGTKAARGSQAHNAIAAQIAANFGPFPAGITYREVPGVKVGTPLPNRAGQIVPASAQDGYVYRQYKTGEINIQQSPVVRIAGGGGGGTVSGGGSITTTDDDTVATDEKKITEQGWFWPVTILGVSAVAAGGIYWFALRKSQPAKGRSKGRKARPARRAARRKGR